MIISAKRCYGGTSTTSGEAARKGNDAVSFKDWSRLMFRMQVVTILCENHIRALSDRPIDD